MANNVYACTELIGGATQALDAIDGADLSDLDAAVVTIVDTVYHYTLDADKNEAESSPNIIIPDDNPGTKRWVLVSISGASIHGLAVKATPIDADEVAIVDTAVSNVLKKLTWTNIKAFFKTYFDTLYITKALGTTKGDIVGFSGSATPVRLGIGTNNYVLTADSGESSGLNWTAAGGQDSIDYVKVSDVKAYNAYGGTFTQGAWRTRDINTEDSDASSICSINSNQITLAAGTYICSISAPAYQVLRHTLRLYNITDSSVTLIGTSGRNGTTTDMVTRLFVNGKFTIATQKILEVQHYCSNTKADQGFGDMANISGTNSVYAIAEFWRIAT